jgi:hypothetical protein
MFTTFNFLFSKFFVAKMVLAASLQACPVQPQRLLADLKDFERCTNSDQCEMFREHCLRGYCRSIAFHCNFDRDCSFTEKCRNGRCE